MCPISVRMADFARWAVAASPSLGWDPEHFLDAYEANRKESDALAVESSPIGRFLVQLVEPRDWEGTAAALLEELESIADDDPRRNAALPDLRQSAAASLVTFGRLS